MKEITITINAASDMEAFTIKTALQNIAANFTKENLVYIAELSKKEKVNEKFAGMKTNPFLKTLLK